MRILFASYLLFCTIIMGCAQGEQPELTVDFAQLEMRGDQYNPTAFLEDEPFSGWAITYANGGAKYIEQQYKNGIREGAWRVYYPNGQLEKEGFKKDKLDHGLYKEWYRNGQLKYEYHYSAGKKVGKWLSWYEDGTRYTERNFVNDQLNGKVFVWDEQGVLAKEYDYQNGDLIHRKMHFKENEN